MLVALANKIGYRQAAPAKATQVKGQSQARAAARPATKEVEPTGEFDDESKPKPAADANELAQIPRRTNSGLSSLSNVKATHSGVKPLHSRLPLTGQHAKPAVPAAEQATQAEPMEKSMRSLRSSTNAQPLLTKRAGLWTKLSAVFNKLLGR